MLLEELGLLVHEEVLVDLNALREDAELDIEVGVLLPLQAVLDGVQRVLVEALVVAAPLLLPLPLALALPDVELGVVLALLLPEAGDVYVAGVRVPALLRRRSL